MVEGRYFVLSDHLDTGVTEPREHRWRLHAAAGYDEGGLFAMGPISLTVERELGGVEVFLAATIPEVDASPDATALALVEPPFVEYQSPHVHRYDQERRIGHHGVMDGLIHARAPGYLAVLAPYRVGDAPSTEHGPLEVTLVDRPLPPTPGSGSLAAFEIRTHNARDLALHRAEDAPVTFTLPEGTTLETDARLVILRLEGPRSFALLVRGSYLRVDGVTMLSGEDPEGVTLSEP